MSVWRIDGAARAAGYVIPALAGAKARAVRLGMRGAEFRHRDGFQTTDYALSDLAGGTSQNRRFAELPAVSQANPDFSPQ
ncbi:hypothetical protein GCM10010347_31780 [Streptomyces cirratus]|uniref:Uncharacterized protein n=1 Tax=Streptomyces cirratus TaxID=68187 RepID=A0ABQ3EXS8_9ACTN|nr:hypothetical protein GCM10010347_31780 [Streptomyces cirratus]